MRLSGIAVPTAATTITTNIASNWIAVSMEINSVDR
jgi:hypothetical protein